MGVPVLNTSRLSSTQVQMAQIIEREFLAAGFSPYVVAAAVVNAYGESRLDPNAVGDGGHSIGLFQLHDGGGGKGMSAAQRQDPVQNTRRIIEEARRAKSFMAIVNSTDVGDLTAAFSTYVERPADKPGAEKRRRAFAAELYPSSSSALSLPGVPSLASAERSTGWWVTTVGLALASLAVAFVVRKRRQADAELEYAE